MRRNDPRFVPRVKQLLWKQTSGICAGLNGRKDGGSCRNVLLNGKKLYLLDKLAAFRGMGLWALRLSFTTENAGEVDKVLADWVRGGTFEPGSYTRGLYQRGVE